MSGVPSGVHVRGLIRRFGERTVLDRLNLDPAEGAAVPRPTAVVFQEARLLPWAPVWQNVMLGLDGADARSRAAKALQEVGLARHAGAWPLTLSGGEAGRVALKALFAPRGVAVSWVEFPAGPLLLEVLNAGAIDFGATGDSPPIFAQAAEADLLYVGAQPVRVDNQAIIVRDGGRCTTWRACAAAGWPKPADPAHTTWWCRLPIWCRATASSWPAVPGRCSRRTRPRRCWTRSTVPLPGRERTRTIWPA